MVAALKITVYDELEALPPSQVAELVLGHVEVMSRPASPDALATSNLVGDLNGRPQRGRGGPGGCWIVPAASVVPWSSANLRAS